MANETNVTNAPIPAVAEPSAETDATNVPTPAVVEPSAENSVAPTPVPIVAETRDEEVAPSAIEALAVATTDVDNFDYTVIGDPDLQAAAREDARFIRAAGRVASKNIIDIGQRLLARKATLGHGNWLPWLSEACHLYSESSANNFMNVAKHLGPEKFVRLRDRLPLEAVYRLASGQTPEEVRDEILGRVQAGEAVTKADVVDAVNKAKGKSRKSKPGAQCAERADDQGIKVEESTTSAGTATPRPEATTGTKPSTRSKAELAASIIAPLTTLIEMDLNNEGAEAMQEVAKRLDDAQAGRAEAALNRVLDLVARV